MIKSVRNITQFHYGIFPFRLDCKVQKKPVCRPVFYFVLKQIYFFIPIFNAVNWYPANEIELLFFISIDLMVIIEEDLSLFE